MNPATPRTWGVRSMVPATNSRAVRRLFDRGQALHGSSGNLYDGNGSAGCVNLRTGDAASLWKLLNTGDHVYAWGHKPGTVKAR